MARNPPAPTADHFVARLAVFYAGLFIVAGIQLPFFPVWLRAKELDPQGIGIVLAAPVVARVIAIPLASRIADRLNALHAILAALSFVAAVGFAAVGLVQGFWPILAVVILASVAYTPVWPLTDAYAVQGLAKRGRPYGPVRLWGSVAFVAANFATGLVLGVISPANLIWLQVAALAITTSIGFALVPADRVSTHPLKAIARPHPVFRLPSFLAVACAASLIQASHAVYYGFSSLEWTEQGYDGATIGSLWGLGVVAEIILFALSGRLPAIVGPKMLLILGAAGAVMRWGAMAWGPPALLLPFLQCLHGLSFAATHLGSVQYVARTVPAEIRTTALGDMATMIGIVTAIGTAVSGLLYSQFGAAAYGAMAALAALGGAAALLIGKQSDSCLSPP